MTTPYEGVPRHHPNIPLIADDDIPSGALFSEPLLKLADEAALCYGAFAASWGRTVQADSTGDPINLAHTRPDSTIVPTWSDALGTWVVPGVNDPGHLYMGTAQGIWLPVDSGEGTRKYTNALASGGKVLAWDATPTSNDATPLDILDVASFTWSLGNAFSVTNHALAYQVYDAVRLSTGRIVAIGSSPATGISRAWRSDDDGASWNLVTMNTVNTTPWPATATRVVVGPNDSLLAFCGGGAPVFWYSTDGGVTWVERIVTLPNDPIDAAYVSALGKWLITTAAEIFVIQGSPATDPIVSVRALAGCLASKAWQGMFVTAAIVGSQVRLLVSDDAMATTPAPVMRAIFSTTVRGLGVSAYGEFILLGSAFGSQNITLSSRASRKPLP